MDRPIILSILAAAILSFVILLMVIPRTMDRVTEQLPWRIDLSDDGHSRVFGFTLHQTTLAQVRQEFGEAGELTLFTTSATPQTFTAEAFFDHITLQNLSADFIFSLEVPQSLLQEMYDRGMRISQSSSGNKKITLDPEDATRLADLPIRSITYLPRVRLTPEVIRERFGTPDSQHRETEGPIEHWLYPERGLDIARAESGKVVIQYVDPADFDRIMAPLTLESASTKEASPATDDDASADAAGPN